MGFTHTLLCAMAIACTSSAPTAPARGMQCALKSAALKSAALKSATKIITGSSRAGLTEVIVALLACPTWEAMLKGALASCAKAINAINRSSLATGRPSPLEAPS